MYYIVGSDNQTHGPINVDTLNQWIAQGRANGQTMTRAEGSQEWKPLENYPEFGDALVRTPPVSGQEQGDATGGLIPYKNKHALIGYYMAFGGLLVGCIPAVGALYSIATIWMGVKGLKNVKANPVVKGTAHAWIAIILGAVELIAGIISTVLTVIAILE
jgi:hypothetical protein